LFLKGHKELACPVFINFGDCLQSCSFHVFKFVYLSNSFGKNKQTLPHVPLKTDINFKKSTTKTAKKELNR